MALPVCSPCGGGGRRGDLIPKVPRRHPLGRAPLPVGFRCKACAEQQVPTAGAPSRPRWVPGRRGAAANHPTSHGFASSLTSTSPPEPFPKGRGAGSGVEIKPSLSASGLSLNRQLHRRCLWAPLRRSRGAPACQRRYGPEDCSSMIESQGATRCRCPNYTAAIIADLDAPRDWGRSRKLQPTSHAL